MISSYNRARLLLLAGFVLSLVLFHFAAVAVGVPQYPGYAMSLVQQPQPAVALGVAAGVLIVCAGLGTLIAGTVRFDAGLFTACLGLLAISVRGGPMQCVLQAAKGPEVFVGLFVELVVLYAAIAAAWGLLWMLHGRGWLQPDSLRDGVEEEEEESLNNRLLALVIQTGTMIVLMLFLAQSDDKKQVLAAVGVSSLLATMAAHSLFPVRPSVWFWLGPLVVGGIGYLYAWQNPNGWVIGLTQGSLLAPLSRPLPVDYAAMGPAGAILGYWMSRRWQRTRQMELANEKP